MSVLCLLYQVVYTCLFILCWSEPAFQISCFWRLFYSPRRLKRSRTFSSQQEEKMLSVGPVMLWISCFVASSLLAYVTWFKTEQASGIREALIPSVVSRLH